MYVALVSRFAWPSIGGLETLVNTLADSLSNGDTQVRVFAHRIDNSGTEWLGLTDRAPAFPPQRHPRSGITTTQLRMGRVQSDVLRAYSRLRGLEAFEQLHAVRAAKVFAPQLRGATVVHRFGGSRMALPVVKAAHHNDSPAVVTPLAHPGQWDDDEISGRGYREADLVVATTNADAETYVGLGVHADRIQVCPLPTAEPGDALGRRPSALTEIDGPLVLFVGVRRAHKGLAELVSAAEIMRHRQPAARVAIVGPGPPLRDAGLNVLDVGEVTDTERDAWLRAADVVCLPSSQESFGLAVSEAWSVGTPVVTSDIPVLRERVAASGGGIATSTEPAALADALLTLLADAPLRRQMGAAGRAYWERAESPESVAAWHKAAYTRLLG